MTNFIQQIVNIGQGEYPHSVMNQLYTALSDNRL